MVGRVGRPAQPSNVVQLRGNPSKRPVAQMLGEFQPEVSLPDVPAWITGEARKEFERFGSECLRNDIVSQLDRGPLSLLAYEYGRLVWATKKIAELNRADPNGEAGLIDKTPNDYKVISVYEQLRRDARQAYLKLAVEYGATASSRSRVKPGEPQMQLPGIEQADTSRGPSLASFA